MSAVISCVIASLSKLSRAYHRRYLVVLLEIEHADTGAATQRQTTLLSFRLIRTYEPHSNTESFSVVGRAAEWLRDDGYFCRRVPVGLASGMR